MRFLTGYMRFILTLFFSLQVLLRVLFFLRGVSPRRAFPWGFTSRTHLCLRFKLKLKRRQQSRRPPRSHLRPLSLPSPSQTLRLISAQLGIRVPFSSTLLKSSLSLKVNSRNRILRIRFMTCPFPLNARLHFRSHPLGALPLQRRRLISENTSKRRRMCILTVCPLISRKISCSRSQVPLVRSAVCGRSPGMSGIVRVDMGSFCTSFFSFPSLVEFWLMRTMVKGLRRSVLLRDASSL
jgi:hypothetical protein